MIQQQSAESANVVSPCILQYDFLHASPPMSALDFMKGQPISDESGWVDVDKETLQHKKYREL